jgi:uncharacterized protein YeaC (DUF1315 family)
MELAAPAEIFQRVEKVIALGKDKSSTEINLRSREFCKQTILGMSRKRAADGACFAQPGMRDVASDQVQKTPQV